MAEVRYGSARPGPARRRRDGLEVFGRVEKIDDSSWIWRLYFAADCRVPHVESSCSFAKRNDAANHLLDFMNSKLKSITVKPS